MDYEEKTINGVTYNGYREKPPVLVSEFSRPRMRHPEPPYDEAMDLFPFYDLANYEMMDLFDDYE